MLWMTLFERDMVGVGVAVTVAVVEAVAAAMPSLVNTLSSSMGITNVGSESRAVV